MERSVKLESMRMLMYLQIIVPGIVAIISFVYMEPHYWEEVYSGLMLPLSVLAAAALFRLARGVPNLPMDELDTAQVNELAAAYLIVTRRLAWMIGIAFISIVGLIFVHLAYNSIELPSEFHRLLIQSAAAFVVFCVVLSFFSRVRAGLRRSGLRQNSIRVDCNERATSACADRQCGIECG